MLINALYNYYEILEREKKVLPSGYSNVNVHFLVVLTENGEIDEIINVENKEMVTDKKGNLKERRSPKVVQLPKRSEKPGIDGNIIEHRPLYLYGLNYDKEKDLFTPEDRTDKAKKSHQDFKQKNLDFLAEVDSPTANAFRSFIQNWNPDLEVNNPKLFSIRKQYSTAGFIFCLSGKPDCPLQDDATIKTHWDRKNTSENSAETAPVISQCAIVGEQAEIARLHGKIKGVFRGSSTGQVLVGFNNPSEESYATEQSYNSNISKCVMEKYTEALNALLADRTHRTIIDEMTVLHWAMAPEETYDDLFSSVLGSSDSGLDRDQTDKLLLEIMEEVQSGSLRSNRIRTIERIDPNVDFYIVGLTPNAARISMKFCYRRKYGDVLRNIAVFQNDLQLYEKQRPIKLWQISKQLISPKSSNQTTPSALITKLLEAIIQGAPYPTELLQTIIRRIKTDSDIGDSEAQIRIGIVKAYLNRRCRLNKKAEEITMSLNLENNNPAYLCGRLFAVLEKIQQDAAGGILNRTIRDAYFASACSKPAVVFPKLIRLSQNHINKIDKEGTKIFYGKLINQIVGQLVDEFPNSLTLTDQGRFAIGYYQQNQEFYTKKKKEENESENSETQN